MIDKPIPQDPQRMLTILLSWSVLMSECDWKTAIRETKEIMIKADLIIKGWLARGINERQKGRMKGMDLYLSATMY